MSEYSLENDYEFLLSDRIQKIRQIINQYGEENFYISFSGGKDSTVLSYLVDMALPDNNIPRVFADTGIELNMIREFVYKQAEYDWRIEIIKPIVPIKPMLEKKVILLKVKSIRNTYNVFKKKVCSGLNIFMSIQKQGERYSCPKILKYQFDENYNGLKISDRCCENMKEFPLARWSKEHNKPYTIIGLMASEGGRRAQYPRCLTFRGNKLHHFSPLIFVESEWEEWFLKRYKIEICDIYKSPYNFTRTGCKGCPFNIHLQKELNTLEEYFPNERKQCEIIWKPVYDEYRRIGYRLKDKC